MRAAFSKAARSNPHWYEIPVCEVAREYANALADRSGQANTFTHLTAISWAASQICGYEFSWRVAFPNLVIQLTARFLSKPLRPEIPSRIPMSRAMRHALIDDFSDDVRPWARRTVHAANAQWEGALRPSEAYWTQASAKSKIGEPVALTLQCFTPHFSVGSVLHPLAQGLAASLRAQKNNSPQCGVSWSETGDKYSAVRSILAIHDVASKSALAMLALREPKRPLFPQVKNPSRFLSARDVARNVRTLLAETGKFHPEQIKRVKGHSPRLGYATWAVAAGLPETLIAKKLRWKTEEVRKVYMAPGPEAQLIAIQQILRNYGEGDE